LNKYRIFSGIKAIYVILLIIIPAVFQFISNLPGYSHGDNLFITCPCLKLLIMEPFHQENLSVQINNKTTHINDLAGIMFPGSMDVKENTYSICDDFTSPSTVKYDLNVQSHLDQPGQPFAKDPGGMAGFFGSMPSNINKSEEFIIYEIHIQTKQFII
jgi:hypothetical protein